jgi:hypothetical protein
MYILEYVALRTAIFEQNGARGAMWRTSDHSVARQGAQLGAGHTRRYLSVYILLVADGVAWCVAPAETVCSSAVCLCDKDRSFELALLPPVRRAHARLQTHRDRLILWLSTSRRSPAF